MKRVEFNVLLAPTGMLRSDRRMFIPPLMWPGYDFYKVAGTPLS